MMIELGLIDYEEAYKIQREFVIRRKSGGIDDSVIACEHKPVFTIGRAGRIENLLEDEEALGRLGIKVLRVDRGGDITFHGPGQIVIYPIIDLKRRGRDLHRYLRDLEEVVIGFLNGYSVIGSRLEGKTGVWVGDEKIASVGIAASDWVTYHGLSVNIDIDLSYFSMIHPCGMKGARATSLSRILRRDVPMQETKARLISNFNRIFEDADLRMQEDPRLERQYI